MSDRVQVYGKVEINKDDTSKASGWILLIHPDFFWNTPFAKTIKQYEFFDYSINEALFLSDKEEKTIINLAQDFQQEYHSGIGKYSKNITISYIEAISKNLEQIIATADKHLILLSPYLKFSSTVAQSLVDASHRGVEIQLMYGKGKNKLKQSDRDSGCHFNQLAAD